MKNQILTSLLLVLILATTALAQRKVKDNTVTSPDTSSQATVLEFENIRGALFLRKTPASQSREIVTSVTSVSQYFNGITIYSTDTSPRISEVRVIDINGKILMSSKEPGKTGNVHRLLKGTYIVELEETNGVVTYHKLMIGQ